MRSNTNAVGYGDGYFQYRTNGASCGEVPYESYETRYLKLWDGNATPRLQRNYLLHGVAANHTMGADDRYWGNSVYLDTTWARVMIGNAATLTGSTQLEMQIPTAWETNSIAVVFNKGAFSTGQTVYLYVIDADNAVNASGYPVTIGSGGDITPPALSGLSPIGDQASVVTSVALALTTDEAATCRYDLNGVSDYDSMTNYTSTGSTSHSATVSVLPGRVYVPAAKCRDAAGNTSASPVWRFAIPATPKRRVRH